MDGILNLNKPKAWTSHDVVARVRSLTNVRRVGHAGTLDPIATGVLLVCLGRATRISEYLMAGRKRYRAMIKMGVSTDTHDADGQVTATTRVAVKRADVETALADFCGKIEQIPPMVSAIKRNGQPLYKLARRGITVERQARPVEVYHLTLTDWLPPSFTVELTCSPGTYVRALARDLGRQLECGAHLTALTRLASGAFELSGAIELEYLATAIKASQNQQLTLCSGRGLASADVPDVSGRTAGSERTVCWHDLVMPIDAGLRHFPECFLAEQECRRVQSGQPLPATAITAPHDKLVRAYRDSDADRKLLALLRFDADTRQWRPHKVFYPL